ncbi:MAG TPA: DUF692 domain-containing protein [Polyangiaceae bacterium]|nr:DUF692 domain-containing protein [Polyangiaceae bacterium]
MKHARFEYPNLGLGVGLRTTHYSHILRHRPDVAWFEVLSDNYMNTEGRPLFYLDQIAEAYPVALHGVGLSIGSTDPLDIDYLRQLKALRDRSRARWVSDHMAFTGVHGRFGHDLYPMPLTTASVMHMASRVRQVQDVLEAPLVLENPSTYLRLGTGAPELAEGDFIAALAEEADCALLLDVNNLFVNAMNHGFDPYECLRKIPLERVVQFHVAGHTRADGYLVDSHVGPVPDPVWRLLGEAFRLGADASVLLEWDSEIPNFEVVHREVMRARRFIDTERAPAERWMSSEKLQGAFP